MTVPSILTVTGSPITSSGTFAITTTNTPTGTGAIVLANTPTLVTPILGAATGTSLQLSGLTASYSVHTDGSKNLVSVQNSGTGLNILQTSPTLVTPNINSTALYIKTSDTAHGLIYNATVDGPSLFGFGGGRIMVQSTTVASWTSSLFTVNTKITTSNTQITASSSISSQGLHFQWNKSGGQGESNIVNQKGGGVGGIVFGESTTSNVVTETFRIGPTGNITVPGSATISGGLDVTGAANFTDIFVDSIGYIAGINIAGLAGSRAVFTDASKNLVSRPGFSYQLWNATAATGVPNNTWTVINFTFKANNGGDGELVQYNGSSARYRNDNGVNMLYVCSFSCKPVASDLAWAARIDANGTTVSETEFGQGFGGVARILCVSATGVINPGQDLQFLCNNYSGFGSDATGIRISITTYPML